MTEVSGEFSSAPPPIGKDLVLIVSGGRTGTTFFGEKLNSILPDATAFHEPDLLDGFSLRSWRAIRRFGFRHMVIGRLLGQTGVRNLTQRYLSKDLDHKYAVDLVLKQRKVFYQSQPTPLVIESYYQWYGLLPVVRDAFPKAKIAAIVRDPRTWVASWLRFGGHHDERDKLGRLGFSRLSPEMIGDREFAAVWARMDTFERLCWDWRTLNSLIDHFCSTDSLSCLFKFEALFGSNGAMGEFLAWITTFEGRRYQCKSYDDYLGQIVNASSGIDRVDWRSWTPERAASLDQICGELMLRLGYGHEPGWKELLDRSGLSKNW